MQQAIDWIRNHRLESGLFGGIALLGVVLVVNLIASDSGSPTPSTFLSAESTTQASSPESGFEESEHPDFEQIDCSGLITLDDADVVFDVEGQLLSFFEFKGGETCTRVLADDEDFWVRVEPGHPDDFASGAQIEGAAGVPVVGLGDEAIWYGGSEIGVLAVHQRIEGAGLYFRILLSRPDTEPEQELEVVTRLASTVLPRFPGVVIDAPEPETVTFDLGPPEVAHLSYAGNIEAKVSDGEWTLGEGLVATLGLLVGETDATDVLRYPDTPGFDHSAVVDMAQEYLATADSADPSGDEVARLLNLVAPSIQDLEAAGDVDGTQPTAGFRVVLANFVIQEGDPQGICLVVYGTSPCMDKKVVETLVGEYTVYVLKPEFGGEYWSEEKIAEVLGAIADSADEFELIGDLPNATIYLSPHEVGLSVKKAGDTYEISIGTNVESVVEGSLAQSVAYAMAKTMVEEKFGKDAWMVEGLAMYLSGVVKPDVNLEHFFAEFLAEKELTASLLDWGPSNWIFFEYLHGELGDPEAVLNFDQLSESRLSSLFHDFAQRLSDGLIEDIGTKTDLVPYTAQYWDLPVNFLLQANLAPPPFVIRRIRLMVEPGQHACVDMLTSGDVMVSWRSGPGDGGYNPPWESGVPFGIDGDSTMIITAAKGGFADFLVTRFVDDPEDCTEPPPDPGAPAPWDPSCGCGRSGYYYEEN